MLRTLILKPFFCENTSVHLLINQCRHQCYILAHLSVRLWHVQNNPESEANQLLDDVYERVYSPAAAAAAAATGTKDKQAGALPNDNIAESTEPATDAD
jgi:hypothetical protein